MILSPYSNREERIGARISVYEEREREIIEYTCVILKKSPTLTLVLFLPRDILRPEQRGLSPAGALNYWGDRNRLVTTIIIPCFFTGRMARKLLSVTLRSGISQLLSCNLP
jgi:hypothetical protein